jgi:hypothetical protein
MPPVFWWVFAAETAFVGASFWACLGFKRMELFWPSAGLIVSLHFVPLARIFRINAYYATGVAGALVSFIALLGFAGRLLTVGLGMGSVLWLSAAYLLCTDLTLYPPAPQRISGAA